jgi:HEPN domain-containing protein
VYYHCQQGAEKNLKAYLVFHGTFPPRTHDLVSLLARCCDFNDSLQSLAEKCQFLNIGGANVRYPGALTEANEATALELVKSLDVVSRRILRLLLPRSEPLDEGA